MSRLMIVVGSGLLTAGISLSAGAAPGVRNGGTFRITAQPGDVDFVDPARSYSGLGWAILNTVCVRLMTNPDKPPPSGLRLVSEAARGYPRVSRNGRQYTFTIRRGYRFSNGAPLRASAFARAINRVLAAGPDSPGAQYTRDIVGADQVLAGRASAATGVVARGNRLVVRLKRPHSDFALWTTMPFFCAVPPSLPTDPEGVGAFPSAGPYYVSEFVRDRRIVLKRNRFYRGARPHHVDRFVVDFKGGSFRDVLTRIERGLADSGSVPPPVWFENEPRLAARYGVNRGRFYLKPGLALSGFALNTAGPLFRSNPQLRRAVNFAVDRAAIRRIRGGRLTSVLTDHYLPPGIPGHRDTRIYPLAKPNLAKARRLARGRLRGGKAVLLTFDVPSELAVAQVVKRQLERIGLDVTVTGLPPQAYYSRVFAPDARYDIAFLGWAPDYYDPSTYLNGLFEGGPAAVINLSRLNSPAYNRRLRHAAGLRGDRRYRAYGKLDVAFARGPAPMIAYAVDNEPTLVSKRVDPRCVVLRPALDLAAVCLKR